MEDATAEYFLGQQILGPKLVNWFSHRTRPFQQNDLRMHVEKDFL